jgi:nitroimidazol reductase NimA-like FMN-containing flavoprotein (pyridoxamine 5'-phosphate oxidase superfamily)
MNDPTSTLDGRFSDPEARPLEWSEAVQILRDAPLSWLTTVRADGRPHMTPLIGVWADGAPHFCTGPAEQKALNLVANAQCALTTGTNALDAGTDIVVEGRAVRVLDEQALGSLARAWEAKYGTDWHFDVEREMFTNAGHHAHVFRIEPAKVLAFAKAPYGQTTWRF